ncbi:hypothetical protein CANINC_003377 [Pichia inconspicua]|uniref:UBX domain-containing protein n=1 Tax=Pichia inconspicua TaxID=52247 RepID=A0A4T0X0B2_9ASCO|nr:hypothetical protein CANINC_003377 [[Candida] inconspicua]
MEGFQLTFNTDAMATIQCAVTKNRPLMILIKDDDNSADKWINELLIDNNNLQATSKKILLEKFVRLQLIKGSQEFQNFLAMMPMFEHAETPCILIVCKGQVVDLIPKGADPSEIEQKIIKVEGNLQSNTNSTALTQEEISGITTTVLSETGRSSYQSQTPPPNYYTSSPGPENSFKDTNEEEKTNNNSYNRTLKEESNDMAARIYQENLAKQRRQAKEDRQRILRLMELDRLEKKKATLRLENVDEVHENLHNNNILNSVDYTLQLKLLDGSTIRRQFLATAKLAEVRNHILETYQDYHSVKFYFFKPIERVTYGDADENKTLHDLNLNMTTLILKPIEHEPESVIATEYPKSNISWLKSKMSSLIWGNNQPTLETHSSNTSNSGSASNISHDEESESNSAYHTPILTHTGSNSRLKPVLSSFNLYGSLQSEERGSAPQLLIDEDNRDLSREDSASLSEDIDVHNGNSISLKFPDEPK